MMKILRRTVLVLFLVTLVAFAVFSVVDRLTTDTTMPLITVPDGTLPISINDAKEKLLEGCNKTSTDWSNGSTCTELIKRNSWKIPKDYPW